MACDEASVGGAVAVGPDAVLTSAHVVAGAVEPFVVRTLDGRELAGTLRAIDTELDLALLDVPDLAAMAVTFGAPEAGSVVQIAAMNGEAELTPVQTTVSRVLHITSGDIYDEGDVQRVGLELATDIEPGTSGAGVFATDGSLVGVVFADSRDRDVSYAIAAEEVEAFLDSPPPLGSRPPCA